MKNSKFNFNSKLGVTLVALIVTVIVLVVIAGISISMIVKDKGIIDKSRGVEEENNQQVATETINLKITKIQLASYRKNGELATLQYLANELCEDSDIEYVKKTQSVASLSPIDVSDVDSIFTKLKNYPYEFEINSSLQLASIDGIEIAGANTDVVSRKEYNALLAKVEKLEEQNNIQSNNMQSPVLLTTAELPATGTATRSAGEYWASSTAYNKSSTEAMSEYLEYIEGTGWKVKKSGLYLFNAESIGNWVTGTGYSQMYSGIYVNGKAIRGLLTLNQVGEYDRYGSNSSSSSIWLSEGDILDLWYNITTTVSYSRFTVHIYSMSR